MANCSQKTYFEIPFIPYHLWGVIFIVRLQQYLGRFVPFFNIISIITQPQVALYFIFPITFYIGPHLGISVLWSAVVAEALNTFLKIILQGDRPYWWVKENKKCYLAMKQYSTTCEISPGTPSGHVFVSSAVWATILFMWCNCQPETCAKRRTKLLSILFVVLICISRMIVAAHFPHQVLLGLFLGIMVASVLTHCQFYKNSPLFYFRAALLLFIMGLAIWKLMPMLGFCNCWSVRKAKRFCLKPIWVRRCMPKPFISYIKLASTLTGTGLAMMIISSLQNCKVHLQNSVRVRFFSVIISLAFTSFIYFKLNKYGAPGLPGYTYIMMKNMLIPLTVIVFVPLFIGIYHQ